MIVVSRETYVYGTQIWLGSSQTLGRGREFFLQDWVCLCVEYSAPGYHLSQFSAKSTLEHHHVESPLNPIPFNFPSKYSKQVLWSWVAACRGPAELFPPVSKRNDSKSPVLLLHLPDVLSCPSRGSGETLPATESSHRACFNMLLLCFTAVD